MSVTLLVHPDHHRGFTYAQRDLGPLNDAPGYNPRSVQQVTVTLIDDPAFTFLIVAPNGSEWRWERQAPGEETVRGLWGWLKNGNPMNFYISTCNDSHIVLSNYRWPEAYPQGPGNGVGGAVYHLQFRRVMDTQSRFCAALQDLHARVITLPS